jgi:hypothetical protein
MQRKEGDPEPLGSLRNGLVASSPVHDAGPNTEARHILHLRCRPTIHIGGEDSELEHIQGGNTFSALNVSSAPNVP